MGRPRKEKLMEDHALAYVEGELYTHLARKAQLEWLKTSMATEGMGSQIRPDGGSRSQGRVSNPTLARVIQMESRLRDLDREVRAMEQGLALLSDMEREVVTLLYLKRQCTTTGAAERLGYSQRQINRLRYLALYQIGIVLGVAHPLAVGAE